MTQKTVFMDINPLAFQIGEATVGIRMRIEHATGDLIEVNDAFGETHKDGGRPATNEECCRFHTSLTEKSEGRFDPRKPLPPQVAKWLRATARRMLEAADAVDAVDDDRDRRLIRRAVAGDVAVVFDGVSEFVVATQDPVAA